MTAEPGFARHLGRVVVGAELVTHGVAEDWLRPFSVVAAPNGYGEEVWNLTQPDSLIAVLFDGGEIRSEVPGAVGRAARAGERGLNLQAKGACNRYLASRALRFGHFYLTDGLLSRITGGFDVQDFTQASLRPDLFMFDDAILSRLLRDYGRRSLDRRAPASRIEMEARAAGRRAADLVSSSRARARTYRGRACGLGGQADLRGDGGAAGRAVPWRARSGAWRRERLS